MALYYVDPANPPGSGKLMSIGTASNMLIKQFNFPHIYDNEKDEIETDWSDHIERRDYNKYRTLVEKHFGKNAHPNNLHPYIEQNSDEKNLKALIEICDADRKIEWVGYRVLGTVDGSGWNVYEFKLFWKHPDTETEMFSATDAPNVLKKVYP